MNCPKLILFLVVLAALGCRPLAPLFPLQTKPIEAKELEVTVKPATGSLLVVRLRNTSKLPINIMSPVLDTSLMLVRPSGSHLRTPTLKPYPTFGKEAFHKLAPGLSEEHQIDLSAVVDPGASDEGDYECLLRYSPEAGNVSARNSKWELAAPIVSDSPVFIVQVRGHTFTLDLSARPTPH